MRPIRTLLVDDEPLARSLLRELLADFPTLTVTGECANGTEALAALQMGTYDIVFLDVQMPDLDGVQVLRRLQGAGQPLPLVVFVTAYDKYAVQAFALHAVDYLLKPLDPDRFADCVGRVQQQLALRQQQAYVPELEALLHSWTAPAVDYQDQFLVKLPERSFFVLAAEVCYFEATGNERCTAARGRSALPAAHGSGPAGRAAGPVRISAYPPLVHCQHGPHRGLQALVARRVPVSHGQRPARNLLAQLQRRGSAAAETLRLSRPGTLKAGSPRDKSS